MATDVFNHDVPAPSLAEARFAPLTPAPAAHDDAPAAREAAPATPIARLELLVRDPVAFTELLDHAERAADASDALVALARTLVGALVLGAAAFGAVIGAHRGGLQIVWCALKVPLILLVTLVVCAPPFVALARVARLPVSARAVIALTLASCARFALVLAGLAPFVWLMEGWSMGYHRVILAVVAVCAIAGFSGARVLAGSLSRAGSVGARVGVAFALLFALVGAQTSWILRPYVVRPRTEHIPFVRALEGDFLESVLTSARSAADVYSPESEARAAAARRNSRAVQAPRSCEGSSCD